MREDMGWLWTKIYIHLSSSKMTPFSWRSKTSHHRIRLVQRWTGSTCKGLARSQNINEKRGHRQRKEGERELILSLEIIRERICAVCTCAVVWRIWSNTNSEKDARWYGHDDAASSCYVVQTSSHKMNTATRRENGSWDGFGGWIRAEMSCHRIHSEMNQIPTNRTISSFVM